MRACLVLGSAGAQVEALFAREAPSERVHGGAGNARRLFRAGSLVFVACLLIQLSTGAQVKAVGRVLIICESGPHSPLTSLVDPGSRFTTNDSGPMVVAAANTPVFSLNDRNLNHGEVGGDVSNAVEQGKIAGNMALRILNGEKPQDIPAVKNETSYMSDWRALKRWGMKEKDLPPGSVVLNRQQSVWESYKWYIVGAIALILAEMAVILALVWQRAWRRRAEGDLAIAYDRLRLAVEAGHSVAWDWDIKSGGDQRFGDLETMFGITSGTHSGHVDEFRNFVHPEDRERVWNALTDARQGGKPYMCEFRVVRKDGIVRWITARGQFYYGNNGEAERMLGMAVDITERKMAEQALTSLTRRLIEAHEEERRRIACEIHDDYQQRLAMLAIDLEALAEDFRDSGEAGPHLYDFSNRASELGADLHSLSHRLYSSTLQSLGLVAGVRAFCEEFAEQQGIQVDFVHEGVPRAIPEDAALCFFRVAQEGLCNIKRHSGAGSAEVCLECKSGQLHLSVRDRGTGFDAHNPAAEYGVGIHSMEERVRLLGGRLEIRSRPKEGTRIDAYLPLKIARAA